VLFDGPGMVAWDVLVPRVAREDDVPLVRATSLQETLQNTAQFVGPLAAGFLIATVAEQGMLLVAAAMFAAAMALIAGPVVPGVRACRGFRASGRSGSPGVRAFWRSGRSGRPAVPGGPAAGLRTAARTRTPVGYPPGRGPITRVWGYRTPSEWG
jgi:hypothetical protein